jgi:hypothetical protein
MGTGFDKLPNTSYFTLRFPHIQKVHKDRTLKDTVSYDELQKLAKHAMKLFSGGEGEEHYWLERLQQADPRSDCRIGNTGCQAFAGMNQIDIAWRSDKRGRRVAEEKSSLRKRKLSSEDSPRLTMPGKRVKVSLAQNKLLKRVVRTPFGGL